MLEHKSVRQDKVVEDHERGPFILTYTGKVFPFDCVRRDCIDIRDIAHALSYLCRFTGHVSEFYSVAQHSLLVSEKVGGGPAAELVGLLHDAAEAYTNDLASPLKEWMKQARCEYCERGVESGSAYSSLQDLITRIIYAKYGVTRIPSDVELYDQAACVFEAEGFMGLTQEELERYSFPTYLQGLWQPWDPATFAGQQADREFEDVEAEFLTRFENLMYQLGREDNGN